jgi:hypothetical protein
MKSLRNFFLVALAFALLPVAALAQTDVNRQPKFVASQAWLDIGNGPFVIVPLAGNGFMYTASGSGVGSTSGSSTTLTLTASAAAKAPCVGCGISGAGITAGTTVAAFNGTTTVTLSAAMTVAASTALSWGVACPTSGAPGAATNISAPTDLRASAGIPSLVPMYTYARMCAYGGTGPGLTFSNFSWKNW